MGDIAGFRHSQVTAYGSSLHVVEAGDPEAAPFMFLHGWPESWSSWRQVMALASQQVRAVAIDLPGVGQSTGNPTDGSKQQLAATIHELVGELGLEDLTLVGQDVGGMIAYSYLRAFQDLTRAVIMDVAVPGVGPWEEVLRNPYIWHFAFHSIPGLPERLVKGRQDEYFDFFYDVLSADPAKIPRRRARTMSRRTPPMPR
jgi:pimeloyl-ACP methyl ester carboxylesterase